MLMKDACGEMEVFDEETLGEVKSRRILFQPGSRCTNALK